MNSPPYNYLHFTVNHYNYGLFSGPGIGMQASDFSTQTIEGKTVRLTDFFGRTVVMETGSRTCGMFVGKIPAMQRLQAQYPDVTFLVLYVREAHPGESAPAHKSFEEKLRDARMLVSEEREQRTVLVDSLDGSVHRAYGSFPNMVYIFDPAGRVISRHIWNNPRKVGEVLAALKSGRNIPHRETRDFVLSLRGHRKALQRGGWTAWRDAVCDLPNLMNVHVRKARLRRQQEMQGSAATRKDSVHRA